MLVRSVQYVVSLLLFASICYFLITRLTFCNTIFMFVVCLVFLFPVLRILCFCVVLCIVSTFVYSCLFPNSEMCHPLCV